MTEMQNLVGRLQDGHRDKSIIKKRKLKEMGNIELNELGESVGTTQCPTCLRQSEEGRNNSLRIWQVFDTLTRTH